MPKEKTEKRTRDHAQRCVQGLSLASRIMHRCIQISYSINAGIIMDWSLPPIPGIMFNKDKGQHILKNPLIINAMIEKVRITYVIMVKGRP